MEGIEHPPMESPFSLEPDKGIFPLIFDRVRTGMILAGDDGKLIRANDKVCQLFGYTRQELLALPIELLILPEDYRGEGELFAPAAGEEGKDWSLEKRCMGKNRNVFHTRLTIQCLRLSQEQERYFVIEVAMAPEASGESESKYRTMIESMVDPVHICSQNRRIEYMNSAMIKRIGRDATGEICHRAINNLESQCTWCVLNDLQGGKAIEKTIVSPLDKRTYRVSNIPIHNKDGSISKLTIFKDITDHLQVVSDRTRIQSRLDQAQKMEAVGLFAGGIAHDFNNILFPIIGFTEMSMEDLPEDHPVRENLEDILSGAKRARDLVKQILSFSSQRESVQSPFTLKPIIKEALKLLRSIIPSNIEIKEELSGGKDYIFANPVEIHEIIMNLCTNAYHAMEDTGGRLTIGLTKTGEGKLYSCLSIQDTGQGIPREIHKQIFDPYFTTKEQGKGSGLGLSVINSIVKKYGGKITVDSEPGAGTVFRVYFPITSDTEAVDPINRVEACLTGNERILFVDDEKIIVKLGKQLLGSLGYEVTIKTSSVDALALFKSDPDQFDLVITDMTMPIMLGTELAKRIMEIRKDIPILMCTGFSQQIDQETAQALGIRGYINKPILKSELASKVRALIDEKS